MHEKHGQGSSSCKLKFDEIFWFLGKGENVHGFGPHLGFVIDML